MSRFQHLAIIGGGGFGTALACVAARAGRRVRLWVRDAELMAEINRSHENSRYLPGIRLPEELVATTDLAEAGAAEALLLVTPAQFLRPALQKLAAHLKPGTPLVICAKGIETGTNLLLHQVVNGIAPDHPVAVLSGPSFAGDIARGLPTAVTLACENERLGEELVQIIGAHNLRPYLSSDVTGVEIGGALKNVIAIACGITDGQGLGESARAALMTRGLSEMTRLAVALGGRAETLMGLAGLGDLALSCNSRQSRNFTLGYRLGQGESLAAILHGARGVFEGAATVSAALRLAAKSEIDMPITAAVDTILQGRAVIAEVITGLLTRPYTTEAR